MNKRKIRTLHATLGTFYAGLIISFALSGLWMNHRTSWHPEKYTVETSSFVLQQPPAKEGWSDESVAQLLNKIGVDDKLRRFTVKNDELRIMCTNNDIDIDLNTGKGEHTRFVKTPVVSQMMALHKSTSNWWIYYSDVFALSLIVVAVTGLMMMPTQGRGRRKAVVLAVSGLVVPLLFVLLFL